MQEILVEIVTSSAFANIVALIVGALIMHFLDDTKYKKIINILIGAFVEILEETDLEVPEYIEKIIMKLHSLDEDTSDIEQILQDEKVKKSN